MNYLVKLAIHDFPKRSDMMRTSLSVEANDTGEAMARALVDAQLKWPGGKVRAYDAIIVPREAQEPPPRKTLSVKRAATA